MIKIELTRLLAGRTLYWLSKDSGVRWATLNALASGKARRLDLDVLENVCRVLECQPGDLLRRVESSQPRGKRA
jgi:putative transcriptional regulator